MNLPWKDRKSAEWRSQDVNLCTHTLTHLHTQTPKLGTNWVMCPYTPLGRWLIVAWSAQSGRLKSHHKNVTRRCSPPAHLPPPQGFLLGSKNRNGLKRTVEGTKVWEGIGRSKCGKLQFYAFFMLITRQPNGQHSLRVWWTTVRDVRVVQDEVCDAPKEYRINHALIRF